MDDEGEVADEIALLYIYARRAVSSAVMIERNEGCTGKRSVCGSGSRKKALTMRA